MFRSLYLFCSAISLLIVAGGAAYQQQCQFDTVVCPTVPTGCYTPDLNLNPLCSALPAILNCAGLNQVQCEQNPLWRATPNNYRKCYTTASTGKVKQVSKICYSEGVCVWFAATGECMYGSPSLSCFVLEWQVDDSQPKCEEGPPM